MSPCSGCMKARRAIIRQMPARMAAPLAQKFLPTVTDAQAVLREARAWVGTPFRHQGRDRRGLDCVGLPLIVLHSLGVALPDELEAIRLRPDYPHEQHTDQVRARFLKHCTPLPDAVPGAVIGLTLRRTLTHLAIVGEGTIIHAIDRDHGGGVIEHGFRGLWRTRYAAGAWALPGVDYG